MSAVTFETGLKLNVIESKAFSACSSLSFLCIPAEVVDIGVSAFGGVNLDAMSVAGGNSSSKVIEEFMMNSGGDSIYVRFGRGGGTSGSREALNV
jgi:hypothetical protein